jgi:hypothetical protein
MGDTDAELVPSDHEERGKGRRESKRNSKYHFESKDGEEDITYDRSCSPLKKKTKTTKVMILSESDSDDQEQEEDNFIIPCNMKTSSAILFKGKAGENVFQFTGMLIMIDLFLSWWHRCKSNFSYKMPIPRTHFSDDS